MHQHLKPPNMEKYVEVFTIDHPPDNYPHKWRDGGSGLYYQQTKLQHHTYFMHQQLQLESFLQGRDIGGGCRW